MAVRKNRAWFFSPTAVPPSIVGTRFINKDEPPQQTFEVLFDSTGFILEQEDRAKETEQGFVRMTPNANAKANTSPDSNWSYAVKPEQLPSVEAVQPSQVSDEPIELKVEANSSMSARNQYLASMTPEYKTWLFNQLVPTGGTANQRLSKKTTASFDVEWTDDPIVREVPTGGTATDFLIGDNQWANALTTLGLDGGTTNQVLTKSSATDGAYVWADTQKELPTGGTVGQVLGKNSATEGDYAWLNQAEQTNYSASSIGTFGQAIYSGTISNDFQFRSLGIDAAGTNKLSISFDNQVNAILLNLATYTDEDVNVDNVVWGAMGSPVTNTLTAALQHIVNKINTEHP